MVVNTRRDRGRDLQGLMNAGKVIVPELQGTAASWFYTFVEKVLAKRVNRRIYVRMVRF